MLKKGAKLLKKGAELLKKGTFFLLELLELGGSNQKGANIIDDQDPKTYL